MGDADGRNVSLWTPGAFHHARWIAKAIYSINIFLFHQHFFLTVNKTRNFKELALFVSLVYVRFWHQAPLLIQAPLNDILLIEKLTKYPNTAVAQAASTVFCWHLWYFSKMLVGLSFFDERIWANVKTQNEGSKPTASTVYQMFETTRPSSSTPQFFKSLYPASHRKLLSSSWLRIL